jgi:hypothetical protein
MPFERTDAETKEVASLGLREYLRRHGENSWHNELIRIGFQWRHAYLGELCPDGRRCLRFYWRTPTYGGRRHDGQKAI